MRIHQAGVEHTVLESLSNVLVANDGLDVRIIDFDSAVQHRCTRRMPVTLYSYPPTEAEFCCTEIYELAVKLAIWTPGKSSLRCSVSSILMRFVCRHRLVLQSYLFRAPDTRCRKACQRGAVYYVWRGAGDCAPQSGSGLEEVSEEIR